MDYKHQTSSLTSYKQTKISSTSMATVVRSGNVNIRERSTFGGVNWKLRRLELDSQVLTITNTSNNKRTRIDLRDITELERTDLTEHSLGLKAKGKQFNFSFSTDPELYDWQDDIYQRCPLGGYSAPFDFVHKSHIGSDNVEGAFTDPNILPIYAEIMGGQHSSSKRASGGVIVAPRSRPTSGLPMNAKPIIKAVPQPGAPLLEGAYVIKQSGLFAGWLWRERWLTVTPQALVIHRRGTKVSPPSKSIPLAQLTRVEPDEKREGCLSVEFATRPASRSSSASSRPTDTLYMLFRGYDDLYTWRDALYNQSSLSSPIGQPTGFKHNTHVGFDALSGGFTGLPNDWQNTNPTSSSAATAAAGLTDGEKKKPRRLSRTQRFSAPVMVDTPPPTA
ncbi:hypothetical protein CPB83DRAFT_894842 [Crepidotus variabilis]|uniref:non-specific serine/threonine protein kinase n=1 Tax=Crepidotus variabilis TaxID=179855 RepID=A0A9P6JP80_9AGAR|nr:hypothetical protein CPB83DRAFT_894842 [Crepidotus variabilis]